MKEIVVTNVTGLARIEIPGRRESLAPGESYTYVNDLPDKVKYLIGLGQIKITAQHGTAPMRSAVEMTAFSSDELKKPKKGRPQE